MSSTAGKRRFVFERFRCGRRSGSPTRRPGVQNSIKLTVGTGAAVSAGHYLLIFQPIEASAITDIALGTASAATLSLVFSVKASIAGTYSGAITNFANTRSYPFNFTISAPNTWEQKTVTIPGDTAGSWVTSGVAGGATLVIAAAVGSTFQGTANAWAASNVFGTSSNTNTILSTNGATFQVTKAKLEISPSPTPFQRRPRAEELALCQRYFEKSYPVGAGGAPGSVTSNGIEIAPLWGTTNGPYIFPLRFKATKRAAPTVAVYSPITGTSGKLDLNNASDVSVTPANIGDAGATITATFTPTVGGFVDWHWAADARL
jgi:hypothetical protein